MLILLLLQLPCKVVPLLLTVPQLSTEARCGSFQGIILSNASGRLLFTLAHLTEVYV